jgi:hypothetical protein
MLAYNKMYQIFNLISYMDDVDVKALFKLIMLGIFALFALIGMIWICCGAEESTMSGRRGKLEKRSLPMRNPIAK